MRILILALLVLVSSSIKTHFVENDDEWIYIFDGETLMVGISIIVTLLEVNGQLKMVS